MDQTLQEILEDYERQTNPDRFGVASLNPLQFLYTDTVRSGAIPLQDFRELTGPQIDFGSTFSTPDLASNIPTIQNPGISLLQSPQDDLEESAIPEFAEGQLKQSPTGIARLFQLLGNIPTPFNLVRRGLESLKGFNDRIQQSDFGQSRTGAEFAMRRRERKQAERAQEAMPDVYRSAREQGFTNDRGGFSTSRADRAGTSLGSGQFSSKRSTGRQGY